MELTMNITAYSNRRINSLNVGLFHKNVTRLRAEHFYFRFS